MTEQLLSDLYWWKFLGESLCSSGFNVDFPAWDEVGVEPKEGFPDSLRSSGEDLGTSDCEVLERSSKQKHLFVTWGNQTLSDRIIHYFFQWDLQSFY